MDRQLIDYLPLVLKEKRELKAVAAAEQSEIETLWGSLEDMLAGQFVYLADDKMLRRWETLFNILPKPGESIEDRRIRLVLRINEKTPFTVRALKKMLRNVCGDSFAIRVRHLDCVMEIMLANISNLASIEVYQFIDRVIPANLTVNITAGHEVSGADVYPASAVTDTYRLTIIN